MSLESLLKTADDQRDLRWEDLFLQELSQSNLAVISQDPQNGPDGWPYLFVETTENAQEPSQKIIQWLSTRGIGLVVNPKKEYPDFVLTYGMLWSFRETGKFIHRLAETSAAFEKIELEKIKHAGTPSPQYLPDYVRTILRDFFRDQGLIAVRILVLSLDGKNYELAFSLESMGNPPEKEHAGIAEALSWFLPTHYSILLVSEKGLPPFSTL
jgi:hypothetical protein